MSSESDWRDPHADDDAAAHERERRRAEREARRRERLAKRVQEGAQADEEPIPPPPDGPAEGPAPAPVAPPAQTPPRSAIARRRLVALVGLAAVAFAGFVVVVAADRIGGEDAPATAPPKERATVSVTIPEGFSRDQIAAVARKAGLRGDYVKQTKSFKGFKPSRYGADGAPSLEGFLFPATYEVFAKAKVEELIAKQLDAFEQNIAGVDLSFAKSKNLNTYDVLKIASMVEREVQVSSERPKVASVIYNRLSNGMPLGIDATIRFEDSNYDEQLLESRLKEDTPYNTRTKPGLPPGPIGNPGLASIEAAAEPAKTDFLFFVVRPGTCGEHVFAKTEKEFLTAEAEYQRALQAEGGSPTDC